MAFIWHLNYVQSPTCDMRDDLSELLKGSLFLRSSSVRSSDRRGLFRCCVFKPRWRGFYESTDWMTLSWPWRVELSVAVARGSCQVTWHFTHTLSLSYVNVSWLCFLVIDPSKGGKQTRPCRRTVTSGDSYKWDDVMLQDGYDRKAAEKSLEELARRYVVVVALLPVICVCFSG
eukprot:1187248-Prorocentrum_minimum.AAC.2